MPRHLKLSNVAKVLGALLRERRLAAGLTQEEFSHRSGIDISFISRVERGITQPSIGVFLKIAETLEVSGSKLLTDLERGLSK